MNKSAKVSKCHAKMFYIQSRIKSDIKEENISPIKHEPGWSIIRRKPGPRNEVDEGLWDG